MVKLDATVLRYLTKDEFRVLTAVEMGMKNHELVPTPLICRIAGLKRGGAYKVIGNLHKNKLLRHESKVYDGYRLTFVGYDYLALKALVARGSICGIGRRIGVGKESDIYEVVNDEGTPMVLKIHRLGLVSFRRIKEKRDYLLKRKSASWLYMSRLAALREFAYMKALHEHGFPTPIPYEQNRHVILMSMCAAHPFSQVRKIRHVASVYNVLMNLIVKLAEHGLIHCDFNEFNLMIDDHENVTMIDFPQMVSTKHKNARAYFERDVNCIRTYFSKRFDFEATEWPSFFADASSSSRQIDLDVTLAASGAKISKEEQDHFDSLMAQELKENKEGKHQHVESTRRTGDSDYEDEIPDLTPEQIEQLAATQLDPVDGDHDIETLGDDFDQLSHHDEKKSPTEGGRERAQEADGDEHLDLNALTGAVSLNAAGHASSCYVNTSFDNNDDNPYDREAFPLDHGNNRDQLFEPIPNKNTTAIHGDDQDIENDGSDDGEDGGHSDDGGDESDGKAAKRRKKPRRRKPKKNHDEASIRARVKKMKGRVGFGGKKGRGRGGGSRGHRNNQKDKAKRKLGHEIRHHDMW